MRFHVKALSGRRVVRPPAERHTFGVVLPVGPGEQECDRVRDLAFSLETYEPGRFCLVLVDDAPGENRRLAQALEPALPRRVTVIKNPRDGRGDGWAAGCTAAVLAGLRQLAGVNLGFALKLDTDALVIGPFADQVIARFEDLPSVGMLGSRYFADGSEPERGWIRSIALSLDKLQKQLTGWRRTCTNGLPRMQIGFWGRDRKRRDAIRQAFINGFRAGDHCQGGAYALSHACLQAFERKGYLRDPLLWLPTPLPEDHTISLCVKASGYHFANFSRDGEPFASLSRGLLDTPEKLLERGFSIVHSVKNGAGRTEAEIRALFQESRRKVPVRRGGYAG